MEAGIIISNLLNPPILFFFLGVFGVLLKSDLEIPQPIPKFLSLYLLFSIGFHGGVALYKSGISREVTLTLLAAVFMAIVVPIYAFFILRLKFNIFNSAAIAATYGSISAVTFITAGSFLKSIGIAYSGYMVAAMALMESPAIVIGLILLRINKEPLVDEKLGVGYADVIRESLINGSVFLLIGSLLIGILTGEKGGEALAPFTDYIFKGMLSFFLLDMGLAATKRIRELKKTGVFSISFAVVIPLINAAIGISIAALIGISKGDALMFTILCASASYIAVPAAMRLAVPEANPSVYVPMSLAITFPMNILVGIPVYYNIINRLWS